MNNDDIYSCWRCGERLDQILFPLNRQSYCPACRADLHVCRMCVEFDVKRAEKCRAELDDVPHEKERANFCDHFSPSVDAYTAEDSSAANAARSGLNALFGLDASSQERQPGESKADAARRELDALFGGDGKDSEG